VTSEDNHRTFGQHLLDRARAHGTTIREVADILHLTVARVRKLTGPAELDHHPIAAIRDLAQRLRMPWPAWLDPNAPSLPEPAPPPVTPHDPIRLQAVLAKLLGQHVPLDVLAEVLDWPLARVGNALDALTTRVRNTPGFQLTRTTDTARLDISPRLLGQTTLARLGNVHRLTGVHDPVLYHLVHRIAADDQARAETLGSEAPVTLETARAHGLITYDLKPDHHGEHYTPPRPANLRLTPDVAHSLGCNATDDFVSDRLTEPVGPTDEQRRYR